MEVDDGNTADKIAEIQSHLKEEGVVPQSTTPTPQQQQASSGTAGSSSNFNNNCYSSLPTMVGLQSAIAPSPDPSSQVGTQSRLHFFFTFIMVHLRYSKNVLCSPNSENLIIIG